MIIYHSHHVNLGLGKQQEQSQTFWQQPISAVGGRTLQVLIANSNGSLCEAKYKGPQLKEVKIRISLLDTNVVDQDDS